MSQTSSAQAAAGIRRERPPTAPLLLRGRDRAMQLAVAARSPGAGRLLARRRKRSPFPAALARSLPAALPAASPPDAGGALARARTLSGRHRGAHGRPPSRAAPARPRAVRGGGSRTP